MAQNPLIKRYLDAGMAFTQMTQARAEAIVKDLVKAGEVQTQRAEELVASLVERSRQNTDRLLAVVRSEVRSQITGLGLATKDDIARLERKIASAPTPAKKSAAKKRTAKKSNGEEGCRETGSGEEALGHDARREEVRYAVLGGQEVLELKDTPRHRADASMSSSIAAV